MITRNNFIDYFLLSLISIIIAFHFYYVYKYSLNFPYWDDFSNLLSPHIKNWGIILFNNEHLTIFNNIISKLTLVFFGSVQIKLITLFGNSALIFILLIFLNDNRELKFGAIAAILLFNNQCWDIITFAMSACSNLWGLCFCLAYFKIKKFKILWLALSLITSGYGFILLFYVTVKCLYTQFLKLKIKFTILLIYIPIVYLIFNSAILIYLIQIVGNINGNKFIAYSLGVVLMIYFCKIKIDNQIKTPFLEFLFLCSTIIAFSRVNSAEALNGRYPIISTLILIEFANITVRENLLLIKKNKRYLALFLILILNYIYTHKKNNPLIGWKFKIINECIIDKGNVKKYQPIYPPDPRKAFDIYNQCAKKKIFK